MCIRDRLYHLITNIAVPENLLVLESRDLREDIKQGLWGVRLKEFSNCSIRFDEVDDLYEWSHTFAWRVDSYCNVSHSMTAKFNGTDMFVRCPDIVGGRSYRKGFEPYLYHIDHPSVNINDTELIFAYCHFEETRIVVHHVENKTVRETQQKIYKADEVEPVKRKPSINVIMLDGVSRAHFRRALKKTTELLELIHQNSTQLGFDVFQFMRYSVMGINSIHNLTPLVSGRKLHSPYSTGSSPEFNHSSWIWNHANAQGYATAYLDEQCPYGPHMTPWQAPKFDGGAGQVSSVHHRFGEVYCAVTNTQYGSNKRCMYDKQAHKYTFHYLDSFFSHYNNTPKFSWSILYEGHEPSMSVLPLLDADLSRFLKRSIQDPNRVTILLADHGMHYGPYVFPPFPGRIEHMFPTLFMLVPNGFLDLHPEVRIALRGLEQTLITAVDIYSILLHLIHWPNPPTGDVPEGLRNLLVPGATIENTRCQDLHIPLEFCHCDPRSWRPRTKHPKTAPGSLSHNDERLYQDI
eukprot:TRINITY_DN1689_c0_g1_i1.p1 TRINITY_DN1689_c0_g1~~TRINITY_DN1689_c0_g1_i1.p1  ORF type:complete len:519 (+),score=55.01 TRINITY_DN1689_c0_g1_i1:39-1595(+)